MSTPVRTLSWPENLLYAVATLHANDTAALAALEAPRPTDLIPSVYYAVASLTARERAVTFKYYMDGKTLAEIGKEYGVTSERIRQIVCKSLTKLRNRYFNYVFKGINACWLEDIDASRKAGAEVGYALAKSEREHEATKPIGCNSLAEKFVSEPTSVRTFNCINREIAKKENAFSAEAMNIEDLTFAAFIGLSEQRLMRIKNFGRKSFDELMHILAKHDLFADNGIIVYRPER